MMTTNDFDTEASAKVELVLGSNFSKLLEGDMYEDELNELPELFLPTASPSGYNDSSFFAQAAATAVVDAAFHQASGFVLEGSTTPQPGPTDSSTSWQSHSPNTDKSQMEMEFTNWADSGKAKTTTLVENATPKVAPQLFGRKITLPNAQASIPTMKAALGSSRAGPTSYAGAKRTTAGIPSSIVPTQARSPIAPKASSHASVAVSAPGVGIAQPVLAPAPGPTPVLPKVAALAPPVTQPSEPLYLPPPAASSPMEVSEVAPMMEQPPSAKVGAAAKTTVAKALPTKTKQRRYKRRDPSMTEEQAEQEHRNRNKEHAKNTRLRKKAYVEALKETLRGLVDQRDEDERKDKLERKKKLQNRQVRWQVMQAFLRLRGENKDVTNSRDQTLWTSILEDTVTLSRPSSQGSSQVETVVSGVFSVMSDPSEADLLCNLRKGTSEGISAAFSYECDKSTLMMDGCTCILGWKGTTAGATELGLPSEIVLSGTLRARFNQETNKVAAAWLYYDTGHMISQPQVSKRVGSS